MNELEKLTEIHQDIFFDTEDFADVFPSHAEESIRFAIEELERQKYSKTEIDAAAFPLNRAYINKNKKIDAHINHLKRQIE